MFGGEDPWLEGLVPSDIEIRDNDIARPWSWWHLHPDYDGTRWTIKNLLELKNARRVLIQGNRFARNWAHGQQGFSIVFTPRNQEGGAPWSRVEDVSFIDNELRDIDSGVNIAAFDDGHPDVTLARVLIRNNLFAGVGMTPGTGRAFQLLGGPPDVTIEGNTVVHGASPNTFVMFDQQPPARGLVVRNNILSYGLNGMYGNEVGSGTAALEAFAPGAIFDGNVVYGFDPGPLAGSSRAIRAGTPTFPTRRRGRGRRRSGTPAHGPGAHSVAPKAEGRRTRRASRSVSDGEGGAVRRAAAISAIERVDGAASGRVGDRWRRRGSLERPGGGSRCGRVRQQVLRRLSRGPQS